ncbi:MAG: glycoside hydrolase family 35 protein [Nakamurella sp.]
MRTIGATERAIRVDTGKFVRDGKPHRILAGSLHYFRVHPTQWASRLAALRQLGLNTVDTYIPWNFHTLRRGDPDFTGWRDLEGFLAAADAAGLDAIVRPGPYICAEWDGGGLPAWLQFDGPMPLRCSDPRFLAAVSDWFDELVPRIAGSQASSGGPVVAVQVENEYGSYGDDADYLAWIKDALLDRGIDSLLFTADGPTELMLDAGSLPGVLSAGTFGSRPDQAAELLRGRRPDDPFVCGEFWNGWFDHWGEQHHVRNVASAAGTLGEILELGGSVNLYMADGGTNFGLWSGANSAGGTYQPTVTSYDSDAPVAEDGSLTAKYLAYQQMFATIDGSESARSESARSESARGESARGAAAGGAATDTPPRRLPTTTVPATQRAELLPVLRRWADPATSSAAPLTFEQLRTASGLVSYSARPILPKGDCELSILDLADRAQVWVDETLVGTLDRNRPDERIPLTGNGSRVELTVVVENQGRINYGPLIGEAKGIRGGVLINRRLVHGWQCSPLDLNLARTEAAAGALDSIGKRPDSSRIALTQTAGLSRFMLEVDDPADAFIALPGWAKGFVWVNDFLLGRYWEIGPQYTLYAPEALWRSGTNEILVLELERSAATIEIVGEPQLGAPKEYLEQL